MSAVETGLPSIPRYYKEHVDPKTDLTITASIPCVFHNETHGRSFSYKAGAEIWRCFGACHCGGDVIDLHRLNFRLKSREEAKKSLYRMYNIQYEPVAVMKPKEVHPDEKDAHRRRVLSAALQLAKVPDDWIELDYIVSKVPYSVSELEQFCSDRGLSFGGI
mgnify:CR=1 FL=1